MQTSVFKMIFYAMMMATLVGAGGCASRQATENGLQGSAVKPGGGATVNSMCVVVNDLPVNTKVETEEWKGQKIGFCCYSCKPKWNAMSEAERDAAVARTAAASK